MKQSTIGNYITGGKHTYDTYKETICLDADMIFTHDSVNGGLIPARRFPLQMCNSSVTFKGHTADTSYYSKQFNLNKLYRGIWPLLL